MVGVVTSQVERARAAAERVARDRGFADLAAVPEQSRLAFIQDVARSEPGLSPAVVREALVDAWSRQNEAGRAALGALQPRERAGSPAPTMPAAKAGLSFVAHLGATRRAVRREESSRSAGEELAIAALLEQGLAPEARRLAARARVDVEGYAKGRAVDPLPAFDALLAQFGDKGAAHERGVVAHLGDALLAAAERRAVDEPAALDVRDAVLVRLGRA